MIPKTIHYCWFGPNDIPALNIKCMDSWSKLNGYEFRLWNEDNIPRDISLIHSLLARKQWAFVSDLVRLYALYEFGGIYLDTDVEVIKPFDELLDQTCFIAEESEGKFNNAVMGATKGHPFVYECMEFTVKTFNSGKLLYSPEIVTEVLSHTQADVTRYPSHYFYPYNPFSNSAVKQLLYVDISDDTYAIHHWANSWKDSLTIVDYFKRLIMRLF